MPLNKTLLLSAFLLLTFTLSFNIKTVSASKKRLPQAVKMGTGTDAAAASSRSSLRTTRSQSPQPRDRRASRVASSERRTRSKSPVRTEPRDAGRTPHRAAEHGSMPEHRGASRKAIAPVRKPRVAKRPAPPTTTATKPVVVHEEQDAAALAAALLESRRKPVHPPPPEPAPAPRTSTAHTPRPKPIGPQAPPVPPKKPAPPVPVETQQPPAPLRRGNSGSSPTRSQYDVGHTWVDALGNPTSIPIQARPTGVQSHLGTGPKAPPGFNLPIPPKGTPPPPWPNAPVTGVTGGHWAVISEGGGAFEPPTWKPVTRDTPTIVPRDLPPPAHSGFGPEPPQFIQGRNEGYLVVTPETWSHMKNTLQSVPSLKAADDTVLIRRLDEYVQAGFLDLEKQPLGSGQLLIPEMRHVLAGEHIRESLDILHRQGVHIPDHLSSTDLLNIAPLLYSDRSILEISDHLTKTAQVDRNRIVNDLVTFYNEQAKATAARYRGLTQSTPVPHQDNLTWVKAGNDFLINPVDDGYGHFILGEDEMAGTITPGERATKHSYDTASDSFLPGDLAELHPGFLDRRWQASGQPTWIDAATY